MQLRKLFAATTLGFIFAVLIFFGGVAAQTLINGNQIQSHTVKALQLDTTGVTAATYGDATHVGQFAVAADGRLTSASNVAVSGGGGGSIGGALVLLEQHTASNSATLNFTTISATYDEYVFEFVGVVAATDNAALWFRVSTNGGSSYDSGANYSSENFSFHEAATGTGGGGTGQTKVIVMGGMTNTANYALAGQIRFYNPNSTSLFKNVIGTSEGRFSAGDAHRVQWVIHGQYDSTTAVNAAQFLFSAGNITSGTIYMYGVTKTNGGSSCMTTITTTGNIDDLDFLGCSVLRMNNASLSTIRGLKAGNDGQQLTIVSIGAGEVDLAHQNTNSSAANRMINFVTSGITPLSAGLGTATYQYDATTSRWRLVAHTQGAWIDIPYASGNFTASAGTWTVDSGDQIGFSYLVRGASVAIAYNFQTTSVSNNGVNLLVALPNGYTISGSSTIAPIVRANDAGGGTVASIVREVPSASTLEFRATLAGGSFSSSTNTTLCIGNVEVPIS